MAKRRGKGEGGVEKRANGKWRAVVLLGTDPATGKRVRDSKTFDTQTEARQWLRGRIGDRDGGSASVGGRVTVEDWAGRWLGQKATQVEAGSLRFYEERVRRQINPRMGKVRLCDLTGERVQKWYAEMRASLVPAGEQHKSGTTLRAMLQDAHRIGLIPANPANKVRRPKVKPKESQSFTRDQARAVIRSATGWFETYCRVAFDSGCRPSELFALHWEDVDLDAGSVRVRWAVDQYASPPALKEPKTERGKRVVLLGKPALDALRSRLTEVERAGLVFTNADGGFLSASNVSYRHWHPVLKRAGVPKFGLYTPRHTMATLMLADGVNIKVVSERLGHGDIGVTLKFYAHAMPNMQSAAAESAARLFGDC